MRLAAVSWRKSIDKVSVQSLRMEAQESELNQRQYVKDRMQRQPRTSISLVQRARLGTSHFNREPTQPLQVQSIVQRVGLTMVRTMAVVFRIAARKPIWPYPQTINDLDRYVRTPSMRVETGMKQEVDLSFSKLSRQKASRQPCSRSCIGWERNKTRCTSCLYLCVNKVAWFLFICV
jgi:hypothetical protein